jgi:hypothetical protein
MDRNTCTGSATIGHKAWEYNKLAFSPCGKYVAHEASKPCDVINMETLPGPTNDPHNCTCRTDSCPCGEFISHKVSEVCTAMGK